MIVELFTEPKARRLFARAFRPASPPGGSGSSTKPPGEERVVFCGVNWEQYGRLDKELGRDRPAPRLYWFDGQLEIMTTSLQHVRLKEWLGSLIEVYLFERGIEAFPHGQAKPWRRGQFLVLTTQAQRAELFADRIWFSE